MPTRTLAGSLQLEDASQKTVCERRVYTNTEIIVGRDRSRCQFVLDDPFISKKHLRIYTIVYDGDDDLESTLLVYAEDLSRNGIYWNGSLMGRGSGGYLLSEGDLLKLSSKTFLRFRQPAQKQNQSRFDHPQEVDIAIFDNEYVLTDRLLGAGGYGRVYMAIKQPTRSQFACKVVDLRKLNHQTYATIGRREQPAAAEDVNPRSQMTKLREWINKKRGGDTLEARLTTYYREVEILSSLNHPNIISIEKAVVTDNSLYIFQELITGGDLFSYLQRKNGKLLEVEAAVIIRQIVIALIFLHDHGIIHRDLKPENILMTSSSAGCRVVLTDFGAARRIKTGRQRLLTDIGTPEYRAPEMGARNAYATDTTNLGYTKSIDMWALGCIAVLLLTGKHAFEDPKTHFYSAKLARECNLEYLRKSSSWQAQRSRPKDFVEKLLVLDEDARLTASEALQHYWFSNEMHKTDFEELYQRTIRHWRPSQRKPGDIEFVNSYMVKYLPCSRAITDKAKTLRTRDRAPVDPPYKPFPRKFNIALWPKRNSEPRLTSPDVQSAIQRNWSGEKRLLRNSTDSIQDLIRSFAPPKPAAVNGSCMRQTPKLRSFSQQRSTSDSTERLMNGAASFDEARQPSIFDGDLESRKTGSSAGLDMNYTDTTKSVSVSHEELLKVPEELARGRRKDSFDDLSAVDHLSLVFEPQHRADTELDIVFEHDQDHARTSTSVNKLLKSRSIKRSAIAPNQARKRKRGSIFDIDEDSVSEDLLRDFRRIKRPRSVAYSWQVRSSFEEKENGATSLEITEPHHASTIVDREPDIEPASIYLPR